MQHWGSRGIFAHCHLLLFSTFLTLLPVFPGSGSHLSHLLSGNSLTLWGVILPLNEMAGPSQTVAICAGHAESRGNPRFREEDGPKIMTSSPGLCCREDRRLLGRKAVATDHSCLSRALALAFQCSEGSPLWSWGSEQFVKRRFLGNQRKGDSWEGRLTYLRDPVAWQACQEHGHCL
jgi:hypothetical protein